ncbi:MAG: FMN-dependent NADH-azoreductase [Rhodocyclaceae bacterium]|nr:MAG: FMN-dependent NADH-azoreductase [Rhodocyclaceae bacterium]
MSKLLYVVGSPRGGESRSAVIADRYLAALRDRLPDLEVDVLDLWHEALPEFDGDKAAAKMTVIGGGNLAGRVRTAWEDITAVTSRFTAADHYLFTVPMWNGGIPYRLKLYIDLLMQPGILFGFNPQDGYTGLLKGKSAAAVYTSGVYQPGMPPAFGADFHASYMDYWLRAIGIEQIETLRYQPTLRSTEPEAVLSAALSAADAAAQRTALLLP